MKKFTGCILGVLCCLIFIHSALAQDYSKEQMQKAEPIKSAFEVLPNIDDSKEYSQEEIAAIKLFLDLWNNADNDTKDYLFKNFEISINHYYDYNSLYTQLTIIYNIEDCKFNKIPNLVFNFKNQTPSIIVTHLGKTLVENKDYKVVYTNNLNVGVASAKIIGIGKLKGEKILNFNITPAKISKTDIRPIADKIYRGQSIKPKVKIQFGNFTLKQNVDFTASYFYNKKVGSAKIIIKGKGNFEGTEQTSFKIVKKSITKAKVYGIENRAFNKSVIMPKIKVKLKGRLLKEGRDYNLSISGNQQIGNATIRITATGNYKGKIVRYFKIVPPKIKGLRVLKTGAISWDDVKVAEGYEIKYSKFKNMKKAKTITTENSFIKSKKLKGKYIKIIPFKTIKGIDYKGKGVKIKIQ